MNVLKFKATGTKLQIVQSALTVEKCVNYDYAEFELDSAWSGYAVTALFWRSGISKAVVLDDTFLCAIPWELLTTSGIVHFGLVGVKGETVVTTKTPVAQSIGEGAYRDGNVPDEPTPSVYEQLMAQVGACNTAVQELNASIADKITAVSNATITAFEKAALANTAAINADNKASRAETAALSAETAASDANVAANAATAAAATASSAASDVSAAVNAANAAATNANDKAALANTKAIEANTQATNASNAATSATNKAALADTAATNASDKAALADTAAENANTKAAAADTATTSANTATANANTATTNANNATTAANNAAALANTSASNADEAAVEAYTAASAADDKAALANTAASNADAKATLANTAANNANTAAAGVVSPTVVVKTSTSTDYVLTVTDKNGSYDTPNLQGQNGEGSGDMEKATYDTDNDGIVDNAEKLGGQLPAYYAAAADIPTVPTKVSELTNDSGYITGYTETDPTVSSWAKADTKPTYTAAEVGAAATSHTHVKANITDLADWAKAATKPTYTASDVGAEASGAVSTHNASSAAHSALFTAKQDKLTFDTAPTASSANPVTSGGVYTAISNARKISSSAATAIGLNPSDSPNIDDAVIKLGTPAEEKVVQIITESNTWLCPRNVKNGTITLRLFGGGGSGYLYYTDSNSDYGGGGGGGEMAVDTVSVVEGHYYSITIGAGGVKSNKKSAGGVSGGVTSFGTLLSANGGSCGNLKTGGAGGSGGGGGASGGAGAAGSYGGGGGGIGSAFSGGAGGTYGGGGGSGSSTAGTGGAGGDYGGAGGIKGEGGSQGTDTSALALEFVGTGAGGSATYSSYGGGGGGGYGGVGGAGYSNGVTPSGGGGGGYGSSGGEGSSAGGGGGGGYGGTGFGTGGGGYGLSNYGRGGKGLRTTSPTADIDGKDGVCIIEYTKLVYPIQG